MFLLQKCLILFSPTLLNLPPSPQLSSMHTPPNPPSPQLSRRHTSPFTQNITKIYPFPSTLTSAITKTLLPTITLSITKMCSFPSTLNSTITKGAPQYGWSEFIIKVLLFCVFQRISKSMSKDRGDIYARLSVQYIESPRLLIDNRRLSTDNPQSLLVWKLASDILTSYNLYALPYWLWCSIWQLCVCVYL